MEQIFKRVRHVDPNNSDAVKEVLSNFFQNLPKRNDINNKKFLDELLIIINRYPKYCMSYRNIIESFISNYLSSNNYYNVIKAAKCAHALQQVRPIQDKTATPKSCWRQQMNSLCNAAHSLIEVIFADAVDIYRSNAKPTESHSNSPLSTVLANIVKKSQDKDRSQLMMTRLKNVFTFIQAMLVEIYPVPKPIQPRSILDVIVRSLSVSSQHVSLDVASVKVQALKTLDAMILCLGSNLIPYSPLVFRLATQTLRWTSDNMSRTTGKVRCTAYSTLSKWLLTLHIYKMPEKNTWEDDLTAHVVRDVTPAKRVVALTMGPQPTKNLSKKAKRKLANSQLLQSSIAAHMPGEKNKIDIPEEVNNEVTVSALQFAEVFFTVCGRFLKPATHKLFQERVIRHHSAGETLLYLRVLEASRKTTPATVAPPTQYCLHIYSTLVNSSDAEISKFCSQALLDIRLHLYCSPPSINLAIEIPQDEEETANKRKKVSSKNRAMLEYLLGPDKVPRDKEDDVITIPDEPSNKKQRVDELDRISLSSDSTSTVKIPYGTDISSDSDGDNVMEVDVVVEMNHTTGRERVLEAADVPKISINDEKQSGDQISLNDITNDESNQADAITNEDVSDVIHEAPTQLSTSSGAPQVVYDHPDTGTGDVTVLERIDDENIPSTNDTDEDAITCGQIVRSSQEIVNGNNEPEVNGVDKITEDSDVYNITTKDINKGEDNLAAKIDGTSVEDMMADFVDEVNEAVAV
ncbi:uncharacterized protein LOC116772448 [Danaus plexippus]|uniref:uncharacterized protein LOC116772448 n=1 Tax=Danaus plexippus TaxID=13037 RepID=UPI002AB08A4D|nr:uncharacterized protein LOC116772448 [Danaus plexippus]